MTLLPSDPRHITNMKRDISLLQTSNVCFISVLIDDSPITLRNNRTQICQAMNRLTDSLATARLRGEAFVSIVLLNQGVLRNCVPCCDLASLVIKENELTVNDQFVTPLYFGVAQFARQIKAIRAALRAEAFLCHLGSLVITGSQDNPLPDSTQRISIDEVRCEVEGLLDSRKDMRSYFAGIAAGDAATLELIGLGIPPPHIEHLGDNFSGLTEAIEYFSSKVPL